MLVEHAKAVTTTSNVYNEVATIILISVVFLIVLKNQLDWIKGTLGFVGVTVVLMIAVQAYKKFRERKQ